MSEAIGYKICSVDGSKLFRSESIKFDYSFSLLQSNGRPKLDMFDAILGDNLDLRYLEDTVYPRYKGKMNRKNLFFKNGKYKSTVALINVTFDYSIRKFDHRGKGLYVCSGRSVSRELLDDHIYIENDELIAIEVIDPKGRDLKNYEPVKEAKIGKLGEYFIYDAETMAYRLKREEKTDRITGKKKTGESKIEPDVSKQEIREYLYKKGFKVDGIQYKRYKRSAGSSRDGSCLFIAEPLYDDMMKWSRCEIDGDMITDQASWQAYISLTLSDIVDTLDIPKSAIMIISDANIEGTDEVINITRGESKNGETVSLRGVRETVTYENKIWDGEALLDDSVFEEFDRKLAEKEKKNNLDVKKHGMLLLRNRMFKTCAFRTRLQKYFRDNGIDDVSKLGGYAPYAKTVEDIKLVVTESSVKYIKLLGMLEPNLSIEERFKKWLDVIYKSPSGKTFGVVKYDKAAGPMNNRCVYTNYQLINTLDIRREGINLLLRDSLDLLHKTQTDPLYLRYYTQISVISENEYADEEDAREIEVTGNARHELISELLGLSDLAFKLQIYKDYRKDVTDQFKKKLKRGRIVVEGNYSTLFGNPLEYLRRTIDREYIPNDPIEGSLSDGHIYTKRFNDGETLLCARSPHITMGNVFVAVNKYVPEIDEYFELGDANTIVCVNAIQSNIQQRLNGCDYDSDTMLITNDPILLGATKDHKERFPVPYCSISEDDVPDVEGDRKEKCLEDIACEVDINISNNKVGEIVNLSQFLNSLYWELAEAGETEEVLEKLYVDICKLAVLSGIEIDKAKRDMKISAQSVISSVRSHKDEYAKNREGLPKFFVELTGGDKSRISKKAVLRSPLSYIFDIVSEDNGRNDSEHTISYDDFFDIPKCAYDQGAKRRGENDFYVFAEKIKSKLIERNIRAKKHSTNKNIEALYDSTKEFLDDALKGAEKYLKGPSDYYYALQRIIELTQEGKRVFVPLYLLCFANEGWLLGRIPKSAEPMRDLIQDDSLSHDDAVMIYGHPHKLCEAKRKIRFMQG